MHYLTKYMHWFILYLVLISANCIPRNTNIMYFPTATFHATFHYCCSEEEELLGIFFWDENMVVCIQCIDTPINFQSTKLYNIIGCMFQEQQFLLCLIWFLVTLYNIFCTSNFHSCLCSQFLEKSFCRLLVSEGIKTFFRMVHQKRLKFLIFNPLSAGKWLVLDFEVKLIFGN